MSYDPHNPSDLTDTLWAQVQLYWSDYQDFWDVREKSPFGLSNARFEGIAAKVRDAVHSLRADGAVQHEVRALVQELTGDNDREMSSEEVAEFLRIFHDYPPLRDALTIEVASELVDLVPSARERIVELVELVGLRDVSTRAAAYLDRATRLYLWGFDVECAIMCRSAIEAALASRLHDDGLVNADQQPPPLDELLALAGRHGVLKGFQPGRSRGRANKGSPLWRADRIKKTGNRLVHDHPVFDHGDDVHRDARQTLSDLVRVLQILYP